MPANLGGWTGLILLLVVILLFAAPKLPQLARSLGQSMTIFKKEIKNNNVDDEPAAAPAAQVQSSPAQSSSAQSSPVQSAPVQSTSASEGTDAPSSK